jgi:hypothetical protein
MKNQTAIVGASALALLLVASVDAGAQAPKPGPATPTAGAPPPPAAAMPPPPTAAKNPASASASPSASGPAAAAPAPVASTAKASTPSAAPAPATPASGATAAASSMPKPAAELDQLKLFEGTWRCEGKLPAGPFGPEQSYKSTFKVKKDVDNFWYALDYEQKKSKQHPMVMKARGFIGYDPAGKKFVATGVDNSGGWVTETSAGWEGDKMVLTGEASLMGQKTPFRESFTKKSDKEMVWQAEAKLGKDFVVLGADVCKK